VAVNERGDGATRARVEDLSPTRVADTL